MASGDWISTAGSSSPLGPLGPHGPRSPLDPHAAATIPVDPVDLRADQPQPARMYDYFLGGRTNFTADRQAAELVLNSYPEARRFARENRGFLRRAIAHLTGAGIRQFLDIGTGIPTSPNTHELAQAVHRDAHVVYADRDPLVLAHARELMSSTPEGRVDYLQGDLREPASLLAHPALSGPQAALDLEQPVALLLVAVLHFLEDRDEPWALVQELMKPLASGSFLVISHMALDIDPEGMARAGEVYKASRIPGQARDRAQVARFADGWELLEPGVTTIDRWGLARPPQIAPVSCHAFVARKP